MAKIVKIRVFWQLYQQIVYCALFTTVANISYYCLHTIHSSTNTYVNCSGALKSSRATKQLVSGALLDLIDHDITNCGLSHDLGGSRGGVAVSVHRVGGGGVDDGAGGAPLTW